MKSERPITVTRTYAPNGRVVVVRGIPAIEVTIDNESHLVFASSVVEKIQKLIKTASSEYIDYAD